MSVTIQIFLLVVSLVDGAERDTIQEQPGTPSPQATIARSAIQGIWWSPEMSQSAAFQIGDSTIYYPDLFEERRYELKGDSLIIYHDDGYLLRFIVKVTADTLILTGLGQEQIFTRSETRKPD
ncbi:MAG: hypothetical protein OEM41_05455 [Ignavibacteria bacterium]|nr:hypothetical protein [Ignavibacteria bacterium]